MKKDSIYLQQILTCIERIELYTKIGEQDFLNNIQTQDSVYRNFEIIGEASKKISLSTKEKSPATPWKNIAGLRDVLIHQYEGIDPNEVWAIIEDYLPILKNAIKGLLDRK